VPGSAGHRDSPRRASSSTGCALILSEALEGFIFLGLQPSDQHAGGDYLALEADGLIGANTQRVGDSNARRCIAFPGFALHVEGVDDIPHVVASVAGDPRLEGLGGDTQHEGCRDCGREIRIRAEAEGLTVQGILFVRVPPCISL